MKRNTLYIIFLIAANFVLFSYNIPNRDKNPKPLLSNSKANFKIIGYLTSRGMDTTAIPFQYLTHINYAFAIPQKDAKGELAPIPNPSFLHAVVRNAHQQNVKVFISIGGWNIGDGGGNDTRFEVLAHSPTSRNTFTHSVMQVVRKFKLDGADIDWEYPDPIEPSASNYVALMKELRDSLHAAGKKLSAAVVSYHDLHGYGITKPIFKTADWLSIMAYDDDYNTFHGKLVPHSPYWLAVRSFDYWIKDRGLPGEKAIMGVPFYGKGKSGKGYGYKQLLSMGANAYSDVYDSIYYNGIRTMKAKTKLAMQRGGGIMIWELGLDTSGKYSLLKAINEVVNSNK